MPPGEPDTWNLQDRGHFNLAPTAPLRWYTEGMINLMLKLIESLGGAQGILVGAALAWLIIGQNSLKARAKEDRDAADKRAKEDRDLADKRAKEDRDLAERRSKEYLEIVEKRAKEDREAADKRAKEDREEFRELHDAAEKRAKEDRDAAEKRDREYFEMVEKRAKEDRDAARAESAKNAAEHAALSASIHELKAQVGLLLDRSNRSGPGDTAD